MSEPMVCHDAVAFYLFARRSRATARSCSRVRAPTRCSPATTGTRRCSRRAGDGLDAYAAAFFDRDHAASPRSCAGRHRADEDPSRAFAAGWFAAPGAAAPVDRALRIDTEVMLVDDPVKRVDNMTMAWGLEARVAVPRPRARRARRPLPAELKLADGGKGVLKAPRAASCPTR